MRKVYTDYDAHDGIIDLIHLEQLRSVVNEALAEFPKETLGSDYKDFDGTELGITEEEAFKFATWEAESMKRLSCRIFFAISFSVFEHTIRKTCDAYLMESDSPFRWKHIKGSPLEKLKIVAGKVGGLISLFQGERWERIVLAQELRHLIVHNGGLVSVEKFERFEASYPYLDFHKFGEDQSSYLVEIPSFTVAHVTSSYRDFLDDLRSGLKAQMASRC